MSGEGRVSPGRGPHIVREFTSERRAHRTLLRGSGSGSVAAPLARSRVLPRAEDSARSRLCLRLRLRRGNPPCGFGPADQAGYHAGPGDEVREARLALHLGVHRRAGRQTVNTNETKLVWQSLVPPGDAGYNSVEGITASYPVTHPRSLQVDTRLGDATTVTSTADVVVARRLLMRATCGVKRFFTWGVFLTRKLRHPEGKV